MRKARVLTFLAAGLALVVALASATFAADGKQLFLDNKCNLCHSIDSQGIAKTSEKMKGAELSNIGPQIPSADWLKKFLVQEEMKDGKKHQKKFNGSPEDLDTLVKWVMSLKTS